MKWTMLSRFPRDIVAQLLKNRGITTKSARDVFLQPITPEKLSAKDVGIDRQQLDIGLARMQQAIKNGEVVVVYGDYDADGITATAILWEALHALGAKVIPFIPNRERHGYGLSVKGVDEVVRNHRPGLMITVDNGIVAHEAADYAKTKGVDLIITDHHQKAGTLPESLCVIHTDVVAGSGVAWFVAQALAPTAAAKSLGLAAIGTVADILPLLGVNRSLVKFGLKQLQQQGRPGLAALLTQAGIEPGAELSTYHINYVIAPRLNAMGRLEEAMDSLRLLCTTSKKRANELAQLLGNTNKARQDLTQELVAVGHDLVEDGSKEILIIEHDDFHEGVIGLVAGKLTEQYHRPSIVIAKHATVSKASARSVKGVNIIELIREFDDLLINAGGHPMAAGFTIATENIAAFKQALEQRAREAISADMLEQELTIDCQIELSDVSPDLYQKLQALKPFGMGNPQPTFGVEQARLVDVRAMGREQQHLKLRLQTDDGAAFSAVGFGMGDKLAELASAKKVNAAFTLNENVWNGKRELQLILKDIV